MVKVLIYSSKEIYDNSSYEGRAEADIIAYRVDNYNYHIVKNRESSIFISFTEQNDLVRWGKVPTFHLRRHIEKLERDEWQRDMDALNLQEKYKDHPLMELSKNG